jgi:hypothetical protein
VSFSDIEERSRLECQDQRSALAGDLPQADFAALGKSIAELENAQPLLSITKLSIHLLPEQPQFQQIVIAATTVIEKR